MHKEKSRSRVLRSASIAAAVLAGAALLAACGSSPNKGTSATSGNTSAAGGGSTTSPAPASSLTVATSTKYSLDEVGVVGAQNAGLFAKNGVSVKVLDVEDISTAMASGSAQVGVGAPTRLVGPMINGTFNGVIIGPTTTQLMLVWAVRKGLNVTNLNQLQGKTLGISSKGSLGDEAAHLLAEKNKWPSGALKEAVMGSISGLTAGLQRGTIDAFAWTPIVPYAMEAGGQATALVGDLNQAYAPNSSSVLFATQKAIQDEPSKVKAFCTAFYQAQSSMVSKPSIVTNILTSQGGDKPSSGLNKAVNEFVPRLATNSTIPSAAFANMIKGSQAASGGSLGNVTVSQLKSHYKSCSSL